jgi:carboxypeptidase C (cathepsin A)
MWKLKDLLVAAGEPPLTAYTTDNDTSEFILVKQQIPIPPCSVGTMLHFLQLGEYRGLPKWLSIDERRCLRLSIVNALHNGTINWNEPIQTFTQMKLSLEDQQQPIHSAQRVAKIILRAMPNYQGKKTFDNVKVVVEEEHGRIRRYFGKCLAFFKDSNDEMFVGVRWYEPADKDTNVLIDPVVKLAKLKLAPLANTRSYGIMPASSIVNGTLILQMNEHFWALQSPREHAEYLQNK